MPTGGKLFSPRARFLSGFSGAGDLDSTLPAGCKDLVDAIKYEQALALAAVPLPPITRQVSLPDVVAVKYLAEVSGASLYTITLDMHELGASTSVHRSVDFELAAKILRKYGIAAIRDV